MNSNVYIIVRPILTGALTIRCLSLIILINHPKGVSSITFVHLVVIGQSFDTCTLWAWPIIYITY